jgi:hypothetical protein
VTTAGPTVGDDGVLRDDSRPRPRSPVRDGAGPPRWVGRAPEGAGPFAVWPQLGMSLLTVIASRGTNAVLPFGVAVWLMRNQ